ncbi:hypothetical protein N7492_009977 [Penicillium capsulatum]|uniref:Uncharacterized protein n=1 Tax=Penicillium capsulatum TaxID=69766 RepID=A0A9W9HLK2_9EURO|nr:hypothetical protein N7492_009977 [Penicillium capsulatum]
MWLGGGWDGIVQQGPTREFLTPWTVSRTCRTSFAINRRICPTSSHKPLSSKRAFEALAGFARLHGLGSQFPIALATAMTLPAHRFYGSSVRLPLPSAKNGQRFAASIDAIPSTWEILNKQLPCYITLSCSPETMMSALCGSFWEPDVPCNLVSPWLHPVLHEVVGRTSSTVGQNQEILALIGAIRRPHLGALWIGAVASGLGPKIIQKVKTGQPPTDPLVYPWTGCPQSFMNTAGPGPYTRGHPECMALTTSFSGGRRWSLLYKQAPYAQGSLRGIFNQKLCASRYFALKMPST